MADARRHLSVWEQRRTAKLIRLLFLCPGFHLALALRLQEELGRIPLFGTFVRRIVWYLTTIYFSCDIDPAAKIGPGIYFPHPTGIVIGGEWDIGAGVSILQGVTLGRRGSGQRRSSVGDGVFLGAGSKVIGELAIGSNASIGANAVVLTDVPAQATAVGVPAKIVSREGQRTPRRHAS